MGLGRLIENVVGAVTGRNNDNEQAAQNDPNFDPNANYDANAGQDILPASQDPYGDPADQGQYAANQYGSDDGGVLPASMDPMGDPADEGQNAGFADSDILPASEDPYGDPADQQTYNR
jgi:hypothetical protein